MTNNETIFMKVHGHIATIYINRPKTKCPFQSDVEN